ncbi:acetyl-CoA C-acyltransferase [Chromobacterium sp. IIBBL 290-4]|uniref:acetyl-CoA C-acyltransferase n=1 Tax=Chromobacterium sp. IIBBL 290-4 TaxID=2953890 RepID=UPI0020B6CCD9|nr:acetyl-CoA C-acyltransferase [Chromobacterium sp. IIBBL 290-4]UTH75721.1 acetyl-CoA C-acyltransferase [Chromobacterium sp. IIBBL 290-4]
MSLHDEKIYLIDGARSAIGNYGGSLALTRPDDLAAALIRELVSRRDAIRDDIDEVILGCANQAGEDNRNIARMALLLAGLDPSVPGITVNRLCASGLDAVIYGAARIRSGASDLVLVGGVESMSRAPYVLAKGESAFDKGQQLHDSTLGWRFINPRMAEQYGCDPLGVTAENVAREHGVSREAQDAFALQSQQRAAAAIARGRFAREIVPLEVKIDRKRVDRFAQDEFPRATSLEKLAALKPAFQSGGTVTAGNASGINDGAAVLLLASGAYAKRRGLQPLAEIGPAAAAGVAPSVMGIGPIASTERLLSRTGFALSDFDLFEINEAFASQVLATLRHWRVAADDARVNPNGGAIALGHPLGMSGARLALTAALELSERQARHALVTMCVGVGQGVSLILKSV